jgi:Protein of unknown function (DUF1565)
MRRGQRVRYGKRLLGPGRPGAALSVPLLASVVALAALPVTPAESAPATVTIHVDDDAPSGGNGSGRSPYSKLEDALAAAKVTSADVVIKVAPGNYSVSNALVIDRPLQMRGSSVLIKGADGWPTGDTAPGTETRVSSTNASLAQLIQVARSDGGVLSDVRIEGFVLQAGAQSVGVSLTRVQGYSVFENSFRAPMRLGVQSVASSGTVTGNHFRGIGTGVILNAGYAESPSSAVVTRNRSVQNGLGGVALVGSGVGILDVADQLDAVVRDNDLSGNTSANQGFGLRLFLMSPDPGLAQSTAGINAVVRDNRIDGNRIGIQVDAGFPVRNASGVCESRVYSGAVDLELAGNTLTNSLQAPALVTFTRNTAALTPSMLSLWQYLHGATFTVSDSDGTLAGAWIDNPASDPFIGPCAGDAVNEPLDNVVAYNGVTLASGKNF